MCLLVGYVISFTVKNDNIIIIIVEAENTGILQLNTQDLFV